jgi:hypothetical protein
MIGQEKVKHVVFVVCWECLWLNNHCNCKISRILRKYNKNIYKFSCVTLLSIRERLFSTIHQVVWLTWWSLTIPIPCVTLTWTMTTPVSGQLAYREESSQPKTERRRSTKAELASQVLAQISNKTAFWLVNAEWQGNKRWSKLCLLYAEGLVSSDIAMSLGQQPLQLQDIQNLSALGTYASTIKKSMGFHVYLLSIWKRLFSTIHQAVWLTWWNLYRLGIPIPPLYTSASPCVASTWTITTPVGQSAYP